MIHITTTAVCIHNTMLTKVLYVYACIHNTMLISTLYGHTYTMLTTLLYVVHQGLANIHIEDNVWIEGWTAFLKELGDY